MQNAWDIRLYTPNHVTTRDRENASCDLEDAFAEYADWFDEEYTVEDATRKYVPPVAAVPRVHRIQAHENWLENITLSAIATVDVRNVTTAPTGGFPWIGSTGLRFFDQMTRGKALIMGHTTYAQLTRDVFAHDLLIVLGTTAVEFSIAHAGRVVHARSVHDAISVALEYSRENEEKEFLVVGGQSMFELFMPWIERVYIARRNHTPVPDGMPLDYFPKLNRFDWRRHSTAKGHGWHGHTWVRIPTQHNLRECISGQRSMTAIERMQMATEA